MWGSSCVGGKAHVQKAFCKYSCACTVGLEQMPQVCPASLRVGIDLAPLHPNAPCQKTAEFGVQVLQRPREAKTQFASMSHPSGVA